MAFTGFKLRGCLPKFPQLWDSRHPYCVVLVKNTLDNKENPMQIGRKPIFHVATSHLQLAHPAGCPHSFCDGCSTPAASCCSLPALGVLQERIVSFQATINKYHWTDKVPKHATVTMVTKASKRAQGEEKSPLCFICYTSSEVVKTERALVHLSIWQDYHSLPPPPPKSQQNRNRTNYEHCV